MPPKLYNDDIRRDRAIAMRQAGASIKQIRRELGLGEAAVRRWIEGIDKGDKPEPAKASSGVVTPAPYARGYRYFNTSW